MQGGRRTRQQVPEGSPAFGTLLGRHRHRKAQTELLSLEMLLCRKRRQAGSCRAHLTKVGKVLADMAYGGEKCSGLPSRLCSLIQGKPELVRTSHLRQSAPAPNARGKQAGSQVQAGDALGGRCPGSIWPVCPALQADGLTDTLTPWAWVCTSSPPWQMASGVFLNHTAMLLPRSPSLSKS